MVVLLSMSLVITPPRVSIPSESGVTSRRSTSFTSPASTPPWMAAPIATTSSGFTLLLGSLPKKSLTSSCTLGIRVEPPTRMTSSIWDAERWASARALRQGSMLLRNKSSQRASNLARDRLFTRCLGIPSTAVMYGRLISAVVWFESSIFAFSAASLRRCRAIGSFLRSIPPFSEANSEASQSMMAWSKSSPPR